MGLRAQNQLILVKRINFLLFPQKLSVESSIDDKIHQNKDSRYSIYGINLKLNPYLL